MIVAFLMSATAQAGFFDKSYSYYHVPSQDYYDAYNFDEVKGTATVYDHSTQKKRTVKIADLSKESHEGINGVKPGSLVLINLKDHNFCETFKVFENGLAYIGCQVEGSVQLNIGKDRPKNVRYFAGVDNLISEVDKAESFQKSEKAILSKDYNKIPAGTLVRIEAIFSNGEALIQKMGLNLLDTSSLRLKFNLERVLLSDLEKNK